MTAALETVWGDWPKALGKKCQSQVRSLIASPSSSS